jgi:hypothetical protein
LINLLQCILFFLCGMEVKDLWNLYKQRRAVGAIDTEDSGSFDMFSPVAAYDPAMDEDRVMKGETESYFD